ncbi:alpha/beta hydrolase fold-domain-containing protein [Aspergillus pseudonomiae]|nr:alpha/beta hydrolase fold-domain-containing protein [Aspergillus pseudonomiae]
MPSETKEQPLRYVHYSIPDADFDKYKEMPSPFAEMNTLSAVEMREIMSQLPVTFPYDESITESIEISHRNITARDGVELELRIYKDNTVGQNSTLFFVAHGGDMKCRDNADTLGINPKKVIVGGSSSGGNIAAVLAMKDRYEGIGAVIGQVLNVHDICHPAHFPKDKYEYHSPEQNKDAPVMPTHATHWFSEQYCPTAGAEPYASPLLAHSFTGLGRALIQVVGQDPIRDEGLVYGEALEKAGVPVHTKVYAGLPHAFDLFPDLKATAAFYDTIIEWITTFQKQS